MSGEKIFAVLGGFLLVLGGPLLGQPVTLAFAGDVTSLVDNDNLTGGATTFRGTITFDSTIPDSDVDPSIGVYDTILTATLELGALTFEMANLDVRRIRVTNTPSGDSYSISVVGSSSPGDDSGTIGYAYADTSGAVFSDDSLPTVPPDLSAFDIEGGIGGRVNFLDGTTILQQVDWEGTTTTITLVAPVPAVSTWGIIVLAMLVLPAGTMVMTRRKTAAG